MNNITFSFDRKMEVFERVAPYSSNIFLFVSSSNLCQVLALPVCFFEGSDYFLDVCLVFHGYLKIWYTVPSSGSKK
jgi:hypothetical protein